MEIRYQLVWKFEGLMLDKFFTADNIIPAFDVRGYRLTGVNHNPRQRSELQGQPTFTGLNGPMYGGRGIIRYECLEAYADLSL
jgi:hypothetical protein